MNTESDVKGTLQFLKPLGFRPRLEVPAAGQGIPISMDEVNYENRVVEIGNARNIPDLDLDREGFVLVDEASDVQDFFDPADVGRTYYPEIADLVKRVSGASEVMIFDHTVRAQSRETQISRVTREAVRLVHLDYTPRSAPNRLRDLLPAHDAERRLSKRFAMFNVWRPINGTVESMPLGLCDARTIPETDLVASDLGYGDRTGEIYQILYSPEQEWSYFPDMTGSEAIVFKCFDSDDERARFVPHAAFVDSSTLPNAKARESIEIRTIAFFD